MKKLFSVLVLLGLLVGVFPASQAQEPVEITFVHIFSDSQDFRSEVVLQLAADFMELNPNVKVNVQNNTSDYQELFNNAILAAEQGNAPHVVQVEEGLTQVAIDSGLFVPITQVASEEQLADLEDYLPQVTSFFTVSDELWGLPWNTSNPLLYYNKDMFRAAGLDPDSPPTTFEEFSAACDAILAAGIEGLAGCANWPMATWFLEQWTAMQGADMVNNANGRDGRATEILLTQPEVVEVVQWWADMAASQKYIYSGAANDYNGEGLLFLGKGTAMHINSTAGVTILKTFAAAQGFELGIAPLITPSADANNGLTVGGASLFVTAGYPEAETQAAIDFAFFLTNTENGAIWHQGTGYFPNRQSTIDLLTEQNWFDENPDFAIGLSQMQNSQNNSATAGMVLGAAQQARNIVVEAVQSIIGGGQETSVALEAAKGRIDPLIAEYNSVFE